MNSEKTTFMNGKGSDFIIHGLLRVDMMHVSSRDRFSEELMKIYTLNFNVTSSSSIMETFLGIAVQQDEAFIKLHLDLYNQDTLQSTTSTSRRRSAPSASRYLLA